MTKREDGIRQLDINSKLLREAIEAIPSGCLSPLYCVTLIQVADLIPTERFKAALEGGKAAARDYADEQRRATDSLIPKKESVH
jgi:hypothetical protein